MGCDIHGWVEVLRYPGQPKYWSRCLDIRSLIGRNYDMFALLFGVRNYADFQPVAGNRGLPEYVSEEVKDSFEAWENGAHSVTYITAKEIAAINWKTKAIGPNRRISAYIKGEEKPFMTFESSSLLQEDDYRRLNEGEEVEIDNRIYRREYLCYEDARTPDWELLFLLVQRIEEAQQRMDREWKNPFGDGSMVRMIVWFDN